ncbi:complexed with cef1p [Zygosaccharomyces mellis]|uniref:Pre-mRNA-splicing factor CWC15 n=1 Tax=Zygosaccharomyces mellis TaxID=42258 RepID=A0A4C2EDC4_9SACH|nr:complexed with cef1p [Zygosaccharomyces mellis]
MTTSHRPQLEARSGAKAASYVPTSTQHARLLPGHKTLKYRKNKNNQGPMRYQPLGTQEVRQQEKDTIKDDDGRNDNDEEEDDDDDDEDDQEALLQELNNIRQKRMVEKIRNEQRQQSEMDLTRIPTPKTTSGWRKTTFGRDRVSKRKQVDKAPEYVNDMTKTAYHEEFIRRFIK